MAYLRDEARSVITVPHLIAMRRRGERITMLTCYDATFAALLDRAGVDIAFIGDSLGNVLQGHSNTLPVDINDIAYHTACVARGTRRCMIVADIPFGCLGSPEKTYGHAVQLIRSGAHMVKLEGGAFLSSTIRFLVERSIPVCAHIGLTPQSVHALGGLPCKARRTWPPRVSAKTHRLWKRPVHSSLCWKPCHLVSPRPSLTKSEFLP
ncbi:putative 3-methyl-2-oxobutanoate hydroxymethyltransferase [Paraburkholderia piptadeniae]|uniref:3-methyl-2-oxobutanoate hydroxymethyltransferase n=1 Tax=Paraburkholderia piptadeniae TaxID=1701573 RepID=A0A1N7STW9_9BURK|nr:putative 3-methyl-2-oxobutanoate hydroxymethyltransferase [Paraburkholderia piptadeniae]